MFAGCFAAVLEDFHVKYALAAEKPLLQRRGRGRGGGGCKGEWGGHRAQLCSTVASGKQGLHHYFHQVFLNQFIYFWGPHNAKQKQSDNKIGLSRMGTAPFLRKAQDKLLFNSRASDAQGRIILVGNQVMPACLNGIYLLIYFGP